MWANINFDFTTRHLKQLNMESEEYLSAAKRKRIEQEIKDHKIAWDHLWKVNIKILLHVHVGMQYVAEMHGRFFHNCHQIPPKNQTVSDHLINSINPKIHYSKVHCDF